VAHDRGKGRVPWVKARSRAWVAQERIRNHEVIRVRLADDDTKRTDCRLRIEHKPSLLHRDYLLTEPRVDDDLGANFDIPNQAFVRPNEHRAADHCRVNG